MRFLPLIATIALTACDLSPDLPGNRADVPAAGSADNVVMPAPAPTPTPLPAPAATTSVRPSFACTGPLSHAETLICGDARLAALDQQVAQAFAAARDAADPTARANLLEGQRAFLAKRDACADAGCIARLHDERLAALARTSSGDTDRSCRAEIGEAAAARLVRQCRAASPATHPPCNAANTCAMIEGEIDRSCGLFDRDDPERPRFCKN